MEEMLSGALAALFEESTPASIVLGPPASSGRSGAARVQVREALTHYEAELNR